MNKDVEKDEQELNSKMNGITDRLVVLMDKIYHAQELLNSIDNEAHELLRKLLKRDG